MENGPVAEITDLCDHGHRDHGNQTLSPYDSIRVIYNMMNIVSTLQTTCSGHTGAYHMHHCQGCVPFLSLSVCPPINDPADVGGNKSVEIDVNHTHASYIIRNQCVDHILISYPKH